LSEIIEAIEARQTQITQLQSDIETLQRAASIVGRKGTTTKAASQKATRQPKARQSLRPRQNPSRSGRRSATDKKAISKRMKAHWAKRRAQQG